MLRVAAALVLASACSFAFTNNRSPPECTRDPAAPIADTAIAVVAVVGAVYFATSDDDNATLGVIVDSGLAAGFAASAYVGFRRVTRCRAGR
jgi:hypothetical protein